MNKINKLEIELINHGNDVRVSTLEIEKHTGLKHQGIIKLVRKYQAEFEELEQVRFEISLNKQDSPTEHALLTEQHTMFLYTLFRNLTPEIVRFKLNLTKRFYQMKKLLIDRSNAEWIAYRESGKIVTKRLNDLFTQALDEVGKSHYKHRYINLQQAIYKATLGKTCQQLRGERNIPKHHTIRDYLNPKELERVSLLQSITELTLQQYKHITDAMVLAAVINSGHMLTTAINCPLIATQHKGAA